MHTKLKHSPGGKKKKSSCRAVYPKMEQGLSPVYSSILDTNRKNLTQYASGNKKLQAIAPNIQPVIYSNAHVIPNYFHQYATGGDVSPTYISDNTIYVPQLDIKSETIYTQESTTKHETSTTNKFHEFSPSDFSKSEKDNQHLCYVSSIKIGNWVHAAFNTDDITLSINPTEKSICYYFDECTLCNNVAVCSSHKMEIGFDLIHSFFIESFSGFFEIVFCLNEPPKCYSSNAPKYIYATDWSPCDVSSGNSDQYCYHILQIPNSQPNIENEVKSELENSGLLYNLIPFIRHGDQMIQLKDHLPNNESIVLSQKFIHLHDSPQPETLHIINPLSSNDTPKFPLFTHQEYETDSLSSFFSENLNPMEDVYDFEHLLGQGNAIGT